MIWQDTYSIVNWHLQSLYAGFENKVRTFLDKIRQTLLFQSMQIDHIQ